MSHENRKHAMLSASGSQRWMNCSPSARLEEKFPNKTSVYAQEGTLAHEIAEIELNFLLETISEKVYKKELTKKRRHKLYTNEMEPQVEKFINIVEESYGEAKCRTEDAKLLIESRLDFSHIVEKGFGTGDAVIIADDTLEVIDLKYGKGIPIEAEKNTQLMLYGIGALTEASLLYDIKRVRLTIVQPRLDNYSTWEITVEDLQEWAEKTVKPLAEKAYLGEGDQTPGSWCKFCKAKPVCRALHNKNLEIAALEFRDPQVLSDDELIMVKNSLDVVMDWLKSIDEYMIDKSLKGKKWEGYKLVETTSRRRWVDEKEAQKLLRKKGFKQKDFITKKLNSLTSIEKLVGKEEFSTEFSKCVIKPAGKPTLAELDDKRPAIGIEQAKIDFSTN